MNIISKTAITKWNGVNREYYENKGYVFTKMRDCFEVKVDDLISGSNAIVQVQCNSCGELFERVFKNITKVKKILCKNCRKPAHTEYIDTVLNSDNIKDFIDFKYNGMGIYIIINMISNKVYIGSTLDFYKRRHRHFKLLTLNKHSNAHLQNAFNKNKGKNFLFKIIEYVDKKENLIEREQFWIDYYKSADNKYGYNICKIAGSCMGKITSEETKQKLRDIFSGEKSSNVKLTTKDVIQIKKDLINNVNINLIANNYNVHPKTIKDIFCGKTWKHVS